MFILRDFTDKYARCLYYLNDFLHLYVAGRGVLQCHWRHNCTEVLLYRPGDWRHLTEEVHQGRHQYEIQCKYWSRHTLGCDGNGWAFYLPSRETVQLLKDVCLKGWPTTCSPCHWIIQPASSAFPLLGVGASCFHFPNSSVLCFVSLFTLFLSLSLSYLSHVVLYHIRFWRHLLVAPNTHIPIQFHLNFFAVNCQ